MSIPTRAVKAVIKNKDNKILLLQRNIKTRDLDNWDLPGGLVEENENEESTLIREVKEELGVDIIILEKAGAWSFFRPLDNKTVEVQNYYCSRTDENNIVLSDEHSDFNWVDISEIESYPVKDKSFYNSLK